MAGARGFSVGNLAATSAAVKLPSFLAMISKMSSCIAVCNTIGNAKESTSSSAYASVALSNVVEVAKLTLGRKAGR
ncbi:hypothetical protein AKJ16_DCAP25466 [Drosera capensis]